MIDPTNTEPIPVHKPHTRRVLSVLAILALVIVALVYTFQTQDFFKQSGVPVIPPPTSSGANSIFTESIQAEIASVQEQMNRGEITSEAGIRRMEEIVAQVPAPPAE